MHKWRLWLSIATAMVLFVATITINYLAGVSADESYFGAHTWHYLAWLLLPAFLLSLVWVWVERKTNPS